MTKRKQVALLLLVGLLVPLQQSAKGQQALRPRARHYVVLSGEYRLGLGDDVLGDP